MPDLIKAILATPISMILILSGVGFLFLSFVGRIRGQFEISENMRTSALTAGAILMISGIGLEVVKQFIPPNRTLENGSRDGPSRHSFSALTVLVPNAKINSKWTMRRRGDQDKSEVALVSSGGSDRNIYYLQLSDDARRRGAVIRNLFFSGTNVGGDFSGNIRASFKHCSPIVIDASGQSTSHPNHNIVLQGEVPILDERCEKTGNKLVTWDIIYKSTH